MIESNLKAFSEEHPDAKLILLSMEERPRMLNGIEVWPVTHFLQEYDKDIPC